MKTMNSRFLFPAAACLLFFSMPLPAQGGTVQLSPSKDNSLYEDPSGTLSNGIGESLFVGMTASNLARRALVHFDVASAVPAGSIVTHAQLRMEVEQTIAGPEPVALRRVTQDWGEAASFAVPPGGGGAPAVNGDATWLHAFSPGTFWNKAGGDFVPYESAVAALDQPGSYQWGSTMEMVADVQSWLDSPASNFGWILLSTEAVYPSAKRIASRETPVPSMAPTLVVTYASGNVAQAVPSGLGCIPGGAGLTNLSFRVATNEPPAVGSSTFRIQASNGLAGGAIALYLSLGLSPAPLVIPGPLGCEILLDVPSAIQLMGQGLSPIGPIPSPSGTLDLPIPLPNVPGLSGASLALQMLSFDATDALTSNALVLHFW